MCFTLIWGILPSSSGRIGEGSASPKLRALRFREIKRTLRSSAVDSAFGTRVSPVTGLSTAVTLLFFFFFQLNRVCERFYLHSQFLIKPELRFPHCFTSPSKLASTPQIFRVTQQLLLFFSLAVSALMFSQDKAY